jgi:dTDP-4-dehydrorhamnose reductase|tara:strand:- start:54456 stop:55334 length:879 start_codon:yes stop_codon:yes gene_type:complete
MDKRFLVIGSTGLLGQALMSELKVQKKTVTGVARANADISLDITDEKALHKLLHSEKPDVIINTVALVDLALCESDPDLAYKINAKPSIELAKFAATHNVKYVYVSTDHYYTGDTDTKHDETHPLTLTNQYGVTKQLGEEFALTNESTMVVRTNIVGFRGQKERPTFVEWVLDTLNKKQQMQLFDDFYTSSIDVRSFSKNLLELIEQNASGIINLASTQVTNKKDFILALANKLGLSCANTKTVSMLEFEHTIDRNESLGLDVSKAEKILDHPLPNLDDVIESLAAEYLEKE